jgi:uncharacterized protein with GYD domain
MSYAKVIHKKKEKKRRKKRREKMGTKVFEIFKTMGTHMPVRKKKKMNKIAPVL